MCWAGRPGRRAPTLACRARRAWGRCGGLSTQPIDISDNRVCFLMPLLIYLACFPLLRLPQAADSEVMERVELLEPTLLQLHK